MGKVTNCKSREINWMKYKIGIIGATQLVESSKMKGKSSQFCTITKKVDGWLFSGPLPYAIAKEYLENEHQQKNGVRRLFV